MKVLKQFETMAEHATNHELLYFAAQAMREDTWYAVSDVVCGIWNKRGGDGFEDQMYDMAWGMAHGC